MNLIELRRVLGGYRSVSPALVGSLTLGPVDTFEVRLLTSLVELQQELLELLLLSSTLELGWTYHLVFVLKVFYASQALNLSLNLMDATLPSE